MAVSKNRCSFNKFLFLFSQIIRLRYFIINALNYTTSSSCKTSNSSKNFGWICSQIICHFFISRFRHILCNVFSNAKFFVSNALIWYLRTAFLWSEIASRGGRSKSPGDDKILFYPDPMIQFKLDHASLHLFCPGWALSQFNFQNVVQAMV